MILPPKQVRNHILLRLFMVVVFVAVSGPCLAVVEDHSGPKGSAGDKTVSIGEMLDGVAQAVGGIVSPTASAPVKAETKKDDPKMIQAKRLDQSVKDTATANGKQAGPPPPYKVYAAPIIADDPPVQRVTESPSPAAVAAPRQPAAFNTKAPPPLTDDLKNHLEDMIVNPPMGSADMNPKASATRQAPEPRRGEIPPTSALPKQFFPVFALGGGQDAPSQLLPVSSNVELEADHGYVTRVIIYIHDLQRNSAEGVASMLTLEGANSGKTLVLAPQFSLDFDIVRFAAYLPDQGRNVTRWSLDDSWQFGGESKTSPQQRGISSFTALDILLLLLTDRQRFPMLQQVVIAGHGMGADFVQRYAVLGQAPDILAKEHIPTRFVVANPSSFMYLTNIRPTESGTRFATPDMKECPKMTAYPYGLGDLLSYAKRAGGNAARERYPARNVVYLAGDGSYVDNYLDRGCEAAIQGRDRPARSKLFARYIEQSFGESAEGHHIFSVVPKAGFDAVSVFGSQCGLEALFGEGRCKPAR